MALRERILEATATLIKEQGIAVVRTKRISEVAECSEGAIFKHFGTKGGLLAAVLTGGLPEVQALEEALQEADGDDLRTGLVKVVLALQSFYLASTPILHSALADQRLFQHYKDAHRLANTGPRHTSLNLAAFLRRFQTRGLIADGLDLEVEAVAIVGACQHIAWVEIVDGTDCLPCSGVQFAERLVDNRLPILTPIFHEPRDDIDAA